MSPLLLARLSAFRRSQAICIYPSRRKYDHWWGNLLRLFLDIRRYEQEVEDDWPLERRPFTQEEFDEFCADPKNQALVDRICKDIGLGGSGDWDDDPWFDTPDDF